MIATTTIRPLTAYDIYVLPLEEYHQLMLIREQMMKAGAENAVVEEEWEVMYERARREQLGW